MRVKVTISSQGHLFGETYVVDVAAPRNFRYEEKPEPLSLDDVAHYFMTHGVVIGERWISPFRLLEFCEVREGQANG